tara:strand:+ start:324 stop:761 length:438 start_codon:yes stop_codon:yes gene_type:complete
MTKKFKTQRQVLDVLYENGVEISNVNVDEGVMWLTVPVGEEQEELLLNDYELGFITAFCLNINDTVRDECAEHGDLPEEDWSVRWCCVPEHDGNEERIYDINYGFIKEGGYEDEGYRFWATAYATHEAHGLRRIQTDGTKYRRII